MSLYNGVGRVSEVAIMSLETCTWDFEQCALLTNWSELKTNEVKMMADGFC